MATLETALAHLDPAEGETSTRYVSVQDLKDALTDIVSMIPGGGTAPSVTGVRESSAMTSLLSVLDGLGIITDETTVVEE